MKKSEIEKSLIKVNEYSILFKIKKFFYKIFKKEQDKCYTIYVNDNKVEKDIKKEQFKKYIKNIENEETKLIKLQELYRNGEIKEEQLTHIQIKSLCDLYDKQIEKLQKSNEYRKQRILQEKSAYTEYSKLYHQKFGIVNKSKDNK